MTGPRYQRLAATIQTEIEAGHIPVGDRLPTEHALMKAHGVSRHTVREALRMLTEAGLIARRQGAGSVVLASQPPVVFAQKIGAKADLMQYARAARLDIKTVTPVTANPDLAQRLRLEAGSDYVQFSGLRLEIDGPPIALTQIYVRADLAPQVEDLPDRPGSITDWVARAKGVATDRIEQAIAAHILSDSQAETLNAEPGGAALLTRRFYYDADNRLITASESIHPGDRFVYEMTLEREG